MKSEFYLANLYWLSDKQVSYFLTFFEHQFFKQCGLFKAADLQNILENH